MYYLDSIVSGPMAEMNVGDHVLKIVAKAEKYLPFFAEALRRNLEHPNLPYFSEEYLSQREITITVERRYEKKNNYDIGYYNHYFLVIRGGNIVIDTNIPDVEIHMEEPIDFVPINWSRSCGYCEFYPPRYEAENPQAHEQAMERCRKFLDFYEADMQKFDIIRNFEKVLADGGNRMTDVDVHWFERHGQEEIWITIYDAADKRDLVFTTFDELACKCQEQISQKRL